MHSALAALRAFVRARQRQPAQPGSDLAGDGPLALACSGGADSTALLLAARRLWPRRALHALHVHHGLQPCADAFAAHVRRLCADWGVE